MMFIITTSEKHRKYYLYTQLFDVLRGVRVSVVKDQVQNRCNTPPWKGAGTKRWNIPILAHPIKIVFQRSSSSSPVNFEWTTTTTISSEFKLYSTSSHDGLYYTTHLNFASMVLIRFFSSFIRRNYARYSQHPFIVRCHTSSSCRHHQTCRSCAWHGCHRR